MCGHSVVEEWEGFGGGRRISGHSVVDDRVGLVTEKDVLSFVVEGWEDLEGWVVNRGHSLWMIEWV
jgi:hypothetical protein